jgi:2-dehydropantoate 2-reductase
MPKCDVVLLALKTTQNHLLPQLIPPVLKPQGTVLVLQNGLDVEAPVAAIANVQNVIGGLCFICSHKIAPGEIDHLNYGGITLLEYAPEYRCCGITERMRQIAEDFTSAGIAIDLADDLLLARWQKLVWNIPFNGLSVVLNANTDKIIASPEIRELVFEIMQEVALGAAACDRVISPDFLHERIDRTKKLQSYRPSMKIDYDERRPLEIEAILGTPLRIASNAGVKLPHIAMLYRQLKFLDAQNRAVVS